MCLGYTMLHPYKNITTHHSIAKSDIFPGSCKLHPNLLLFEGFQIACIHLAGIKVKSSGPWTASSEAYKSPCFWTQSVNESKWVSPWEEDCIRLIRLAPAYLIFQFWASLLGMMNLSWWENFWNWTTIYVDVSWIQFRRYGKLWDLRLTVGFCANHCY